MAQKINQKQYGKKYSTTEQLTGDTWIDGKPIYRKVVDLPGLPNNTSKSFAHGISDIDNIVKLEGQVYITANKQPVAPLNATRSFAANGIGAYVTLVSVVVETGTDRTSMSAYAVIEYTKT